jgi:serine/threonine protein kinase/outer membrane protein OmpA-like peptidoglycan-associated protein
MEELDARAVLGVSDEAPDSEIEAAYRKRVAEVRKSFEAAKDDRTRKQLKRELASLEAARDLLQAGSEGFVDVLPGREPDDQVIHKASIEDAHSERHQRDRVGAEGPSAPVQNGRPTAEPAVEAASFPLTSGQIFAGRFKLQRELSSDHAGAVWLAEDSALRRLANLKFLPDQLIRDKSALANLKRELQPRIELMHPHIATADALVEDQGRVAIPIEHIEGASLSQLRSGKRNQVFEVKELEAWIRQLCEALEHFHKRGKLIHGNIQPDHLIIDPDGSLQLADLGIARLISDSLNRLAGLSSADKKLAHCSPQQAKGEKATIADDIYSLGATVYELVTGKPPFYQGDVRAQIEGQVAHSMTDRRIELGIIGELIPKNWEETIAACLAKQPSHRPKSAAEVSRHLEKVDSRPPVSPIVQPQPVSPAAMSASSPVEPASPPDKREPIQVQPVSLPAKRESTPVQPVPAPGKRESTPVQPSSAPSKRESTPVQPVSAAAKPSPDTVVPDSVSAKRPATSHTPISPPAKPPLAPVGSVSPPVGRVPPPVHPPPSPVKTPETPNRSILTPARGPQEPVAPAPTSAKRSRAPLISFLTRRPVLVVGGIIFAPLLASLVAFFWSRSEPPPSAKPAARPSASGSTGLPTASPPTTVSPAITAAPLVTVSPVVTASPEASTSPSANQTATPREVIPSPTPLTQPEIDATKEEVIKRINAAPGYSAEEKATLIKKMERARKMERLSVVRFDFGQTTLRRSVADELMRTFDTPEMRERLGDQTIILVVAGYADTGGRADINLGISQERAENVTRILKRRVKLANAMQTIGMGGTELLNNKRPDQNRAVEIWAVTAF